MVLLKSCRGLSAALLLAVLAVVSGCASIGPGRMLQDRADYNASLTESWKRQILLNIVKIRYVEPIFFMDVGDIVAGYTMETAGSAALSRTVFDALPTRQLRQTGLRRERTLHRPPNHHLQAPDRRPLPQGDHVRLALAQRHGRTRYRHLGPIPVQSGGALRQRPAQCGAFPHGQHAGPGRFQENGRAFIPIAAGRRLARPERTAAPGQ